MDAETYGSFDFGLGEEQEARAARLHAEAVIIDLMYWGPVTYRSFDEDMATELKAIYETHHSAGKAVFDAFEMGGRKAVRGEYPEFQQAWEVSGLTGGHYPVQVGSEGALLGAAAHVTRIVDGLPWVRKVLSADDFLAAKAEGQLAYFLQCQPTTPISKDLGLLDRAYDIGLRMLQLTYNEQDFVGSGCTERGDGGVSHFGRKVIEFCNDRGIIVDTGHCGRQTTLDACAFSSTPVVSSHAGASAVYMHDRNKSDEEIRAIAETGGVCGVVTVPFFLAGGAGVTVEALLDHVDHMVSLVGWQHVGVGSDYPLAGPKWTMEKLGEYAHDIGFRPEHNLATTTNLVGFDDYRDLPNITRGLVARGYDDEAIKGILGGNVVRVFREVIG